MFRLFLEMFPIVRWLLIAIVLSVIVFEVFSPNSGDTITAGSLPAASFSLREVHCKEIVPRCEHCTARTFVGVTEDGQPVARLIHTSRGNRGLFDGPNELSGTLTLAFRPDNTYEMHIASHPIIASRLEADITRLAQCTNSWAE